MPKLNMETLLPFIEEAFNRGLDFQIPVTGTSMNPLLYQNRDFVKIEKPVSPLKIGDVPLYRRGSGAFVLHRVVDIKENGEYVMCGDNQFILEYLPAARGDYVKVYLYKYIGATSQKQLSFV